MLIGKEYQYTSNMPNNLTNDGHVKYSKDLVMNRLDRTYRYDHVGRLFEGVTGGEARQMKDSGVDNWSNIDGPYCESMVMMRQITCRIACSARGKTLMVNQGSTSHGAATTSLPTKTIA